jgi:hypothetical protein
MIKKPSTKRILALSTLILITGTVVLSLALGGQVLAEEQETWEERVSRLGPLAYVDETDPDYAPVPVVPDESTRPSEPGQWGSPPTLEGEGESLTPEEMAYLTEHRYDGIDRDVVFTDEGVVIKALYMDWYIEKVMAERDPMLMVQSNPYAYIEGNEYYDALVDMGPVAIPQLEQEFLDPSPKGLSGYLFAAAIEEIAKADILGILDDRYAIATAWEFLDYWVPVRQGATEDVYAIALSTSYSVEQKLEKIAYYGLLAVPALGELRDDPAIDDELKVALNAHLEFLDAASSEQIAYITQCLAQ